MHLNLWKCFASSRIINAVMHGSIQSCDNFFFQSNLKLFSAGSSAQTLIQGTIIWMSLCHKVASHLFTQAMSIMKLISYFAFLQRFLMEICTNQYTWIHSTATITRLPCLCLISFWRIILESWNLSIVQENYYRT